MILSFKTQIDGMATHFVKKIMACLRPDDPKTPKGFAPKIHTIRADTGGRWQAGRKIHFATGVRTKHYACFGSGQCTGVQQIEIKHWSDGPFAGFEVFVDGRQLRDDEITDLAINDDFSSVFSFSEWFDKDFKGKIIHWTDKRY